MARVKSDVRIGYRAAQEALRLADCSATHAARLIGCDKKSIYAWENGEAPSAVYLQRLCELGVDINYILTGRKS